jgi:hemolysin III
LPGDVGTFLGGVILISNRATRVEERRASVSEGQKRKKRLREPISGITHLVGGLLASVGLIALDGGWRAGLLSLIWGLALCGILLKLYWMHAPRWLSVALYLGMGWVALVAAPALFQAVPIGGIAWVLAGALVYGLKRPNPIPGVLGFHELWHLFVIAGSACHFWAVLRYIAPLA